MSNNTRKIVVLSKIDSPRIEQAIFILRDEADASEIDAVTEAQKIVDNYLRSLSSPPPSPSPKKIKSTFLFGMAVYTFAMVTLTAYIMAMIG
ncbi:MAG: hypothetical protein IJD91_04325 [Clostridia bacterium]|nr:hypothetical protein [Clostridia bacterium]